MTPLIFLNLSLKIPISLLLLILSNLLVFVNDAGSNYYVGGQVWNFEKNQIEVCSSTNAAMGVSVPLSIGAAIDFYKSFGEDDVKSYMHSLAWDSAEMLAGEWGVELGLNRDMFASMVPIPLPGYVKGEDEEMVEIVRTLWKKYKVEVAITAPSGYISARISAQIYNEKSDYERLADAVKTEFM